MIRVQLVRRRRQKKRVTEVTPRGSCKWLGLVERQCQLTFRPLPRVSTNMLNPAEPETHVRTHKHTRFRTQTRQRSAMG